MGIFDFLKKKEAAKDDLIIDASKDMQQIIKELSKQYKDFCNYPEILNIEEKERKALLKKLWGSWALHLDYEKFAEKYPQYNKRDMMYIATKEHGRINCLYHQRKYIETWKKTGYNALLKFNMDFCPFAIFNNNNDLCLIYDMNKVFECKWIERNGKEWIEHTSFRMLMKKFKPEDLKKYNFWVNGEIKKLTPEEFLSWLKKYNIDYPLY